MVEKDNYAIGSFIINLKESVITNCTQDVIFIHLCQVVCDRKEAYALGSAVSRAFPKYLRSSSVTIEVVKVIQVGFVFVGENTQPLTDGEVECLKETCEGVCVCVCVCATICVFVYD